jgi:ATP-dependent RNA helicase DeaD
VAWFRLDIGRQQNADPRWLLPLLCRRGHVTRGEIGAIRIGPNRSFVQIPRNLAERFGNAVARTAVPGSDDESGVNIEPSATGPREQAREHRKGRHAPGARRPPHSEGHAQHPNGVKPYRPARRRQRPAALAAASRRPARSRLSRDRPMKRAAEPTRFRRPLAPDGTEV